LEYPLKNLIFNTMEKNFLVLVGDLFENTPIDSITMDSKFKEFEDWDSLVALSLIALFDSEFNIKISGEKIREISTMKELYNLIKQ
jgi:acyl carrier protein